MCIRDRYGGDSQYGVQIISDKNVEEITLGGSTFEEAQNSYNNAIETLNSAAEAYINPSYAEDVRCVGSVPTVENGKFVDKNSETTGPTTLEFEYNGSTSIDCKGRDSNWETDLEQMQDLGIYSTGEYYWFASRDISSTEPYCHFLLHYGVPPEGFTTHRLCSVYRGGSSDRYSYEKRFTSLYSSKI